MRIPIIRFPVTISAAILALAVPTSFAMLGCSSDGALEKRGAAANHDREAANDAGQPTDEPQEVTEEPGEEGEAPTPGGEPDAGAPPDTGTAPPEDTGTPPVEDTGTAPPADTGTGVVDTGTPPPPQPQPETHTVTLGATTFSPAMLTIKAGDTVRWVWSSSVHSVTSGTSCTSDGTFDSGIDEGPSSFTRTFSTAGTYDYFCLVHCELGMVGKVIVE